MKHLIRDLNEYAALRRKGIRFCHALCGRIPAPNDLLVSPQFVECPECLAILQSMEAQRVAESPAEETATEDDPTADEAVEEEEEEVHDEDVDEGQAQAGEDDDLDGGVSEEGDDQAPAEEVVQERRAEDAGAQAKAILAQAISILVTEDDLLPAEVCRDWLAAASVDIPLFPVDVVFLNKLYQIGPMIGIDDRLVRRIVSMLLRLQAACSESAPSTGAGDGEPVVDPEVEPVAESVAEPEVEPVVQPAVEPMVDPEVEPVAEPVVASKKTSARKAKTKE
jgi:hypothetical protein